jgi:hypothetical protein
MKRSDAIKQLLASNKHDNHIFERDDPFAVKLCETCTFDNFMAKITPEKPMYWNEVIWSHKPARMYMDCEYKNIDAPDKIDLNNYVQLVHQHVQACVQHVIPSLDPPLVLVCSRKYVFSVHLIWSTLWCATIEPIRQIAGMVNIKRLMGVDIDMNVYPTKRETPRTLRMPFCGKLKDQSAGNMLPYVKNKLINTFEASIFCQYLITFSTECSKEHNLPVLPDNVLISLETTAVTTVVTNKRVELADWDPDVTVHALDWMESIHPLFERRSFKMHIDGEWACYGVMYCQHANKWHKSNNMYVNCDKFGVVTCTCSDYLCKVPVRQMLTEHQHKIANTPWNVDWKTLQRIVKN